MLMTKALKEWSVAVDAIAKGETILLLRKGGIQEHQGKFSAEADRVVLFPTFEHQRPELLKPAYQSLVTPVEKGWHPESVTLKAWADITHIFLTDDAEKVHALADFHIWQPQLAQERLKWKAKQPLYVLTLRAYRFTEPVKVPWDASFGGCRSWLSLAEGQFGPPEIDGLEIGDVGEAAIAADAYQAQVSAIASILDQSPSTL